MSEKNRNKIHNQKKDRFTPSLELPGDEGKDGSLSSPPNLELPDTDDTPASADGAEPEDGSPGGIHLELDGEKKNPDSTGGPHLHLDGEDENPDGTEGPHLHLDGEEQSLDGTEGPHLHLGGEEEGPDGTEGPHLHLDGEDESPDGGSEDNHLEENEGTVGDGSPGENQPEGNEEAAEDGGSGENQPEGEEGTAAEGSPGKPGFLAFLSRKKWIVLGAVVILLIAAAAGGIYMYQRALKEPQEAVHHYLKTAAALDFDALEDMTQSKDMSILEGMDVTLPVFRDFFLKSNQKFTCEIANSSINLKADTAQVTVHLKFLDNSEVYRQALSDLLRQVVENHLEPNISTDPAMQETILSLLQEKAEDLEETYVETDVVYNLIRVNGEWKTVALDRETLRAISANCVSIQQEIDRLQSGDPVAVDNSYLEEEGSFDLDTENFSIQYAGHETTTDYAGAPCLLLYYDYTNKSKYPSGALIDVSLTVFQHGKECPQAIPADNKNDTSSYLALVAPGKTARICQAYALTDLSDVTVQSSEGLQFQDGSIHSVVIRLE